MTVLAGTSTTGTFMVHTFNYTAADGKGAVYFGVGGTDTLNLGFDRADIASFDGQPLANFKNDPNSIKSQAIYHGSAYDYLR